MAVSLPVLHNWMEPMFDWPIENNHGVVKVNNNNEKFEVGLDMHEFKPQEIKIDIKDGELHVTAKHEERIDEHGRITRNVHRVYTLPSDINVDTLKSKLLGNGILMIEAAKKIKHKPIEIPVNVKK